MSTEVNNHCIRIREYDREPYNPIWDAMKQFTINRNESSIDELWLLEHTPVYTQGQAGKPQHILKSNEIPVVQSDRGGQITYHGPGQLIGYVLFNLAQRNLGIRTLVDQLEQLLIKMLRSYEIVGERQCGAPGVYVDGKKIASIGLRVKNGCTYHGIALNVDMDLRPFQDINPCGFSGLTMTHIKNYVPTIAMTDVRKRFASLFLKQFDS